MIHPEIGEKQRVTIEDLLRVKRSERPDPEFWGRFEQQLRAKQLAAIIEKRPWWATFQLSGRVRRLSRIQVPVGVAALLVFSFVAVREYLPEEPAILGSPAVALTTDVPDFEPAVVATIVPNLPSMSEQPAHQSVSSPVSDADDIPAVVVAQHEVTPTNADEKRPSASGEPDSLLAMIPWAAPLRKTVSSESEPKERFELGELPSVHFASAITHARDFNFQAQVELEPMIISKPRVSADPTATALEEAAPLSPQEIRRNRILSSLVVADTASEDRSRLGQIREVLAATLDDDRLYDGVRRLGMGGDRLTLRF